MRCTILFIPQGLLAIQEQPWTVGMIALRMHGKCIAELERLMSNLQHVAQCENGHCEGSRKGTIASTFDLTTSLVIELHTRRYKWNQL